MQGEGSRIGEGVVLPPLRTRRGFDWLFRHPWSRLFVSSFIAILNFIMLAEDPVAHSFKEADVPIIGDGVSFVLARYPDTVALRFLKVMMWSFSVLCGIALGFVIHRYILNRWLKIKMFEGCNGSWTVMFFTSIPVVFIGSKVYTAFLKLGEGNESFYISSLMGTSNEVFMKIAAVGTWLGDFITFLMVLDMCLQQTNEYPNWMPGLRKWWNTGLNRVIAFWSIFLVFTIVVVTFISADVIDHDGSFGSSMKPSNEVGRTILAAVITVMDLMIVAGDWDFPSFDNPFEIKLPGFNVPEINIDWLSKTLKLPEFFEISISGRWFNYGIILVVMCLDFNMMKNQIVYEPFLFGQYVDPGGHIWNVGNKTAIATETEDTLIWPVRQGLMEGDVRMQATYKEYPLGVRLIGALPAFIGLGIFILVVLRGVRGSSRDRMTGAGTDEESGSVIELQYPTPHSTVGGARNEPSTGDTDDVEVIRPRSASSQSNNKRDSEDTSQGIKARRNSSGHVLPPQPIRARRKSSGHGKVVLPPLPGRKSPPPVFDEDHHRHEHDDRHAPTSSSS